MSAWLVTGGLGFIGSHFVRTVLHERPDVSVINLDAMTYAGNPQNVADLEGHARYRFIKGNICNPRTVRRALAGGVDAVVNFAAESHVDRSIADPETFLRTDILGTHVLLEAARRGGVRRFLQVSTDEVYGEIASGAAREGDPIAPRSPYAASKAAGDLQVLAHAATYGTPVLITRGSNTFGSHQYPEKMVPLFITNVLEDEPVPLYGDGRHVRDWLHVDDHVSGILRVLEHGAPGQVYNLGGGAPRTNLDVATRLIELCGGTPQRHLRFVPDRPGHDRRYALDCSKSQALGWKPAHAFETALAQTVAWYRANEAWWRPLKGHAMLPSPALLGGAAR